MGKQDYPDFTAVNEKRSEEWEWVWVLFLTLKADLKVIRERDPAIKSNLEIVLYPGFRAVLLSGRRDAYPSASFVLYADGLPCAVESETFI